MKHKIAPETSPPQRVFKQERGGVRRWWGKKILLTFMVAASIGVVASWAIFTIKPSWWDGLKGRLSFNQATKNKRSLARYPSKPVFNVVQPRRTNPLPPTTPAPQQPPVVERMERPQALPTVIPPSAPPSASPITGPQVSTPGAPGIAPSMPPSSTYPDARPDISVPEGVQRPPTITSSLPSKKEESESDEYLEIATLYAQKGKYQKAEELFQKVAKENPSSAKVHNNLGVVCLKQDKYDMAEREFKEAMRLDPAFVLPYYNLACLYSRKGVNVEALIYLKKALRRDERVKQWIKTDGDFDRLRSDVVFQELVGGLPPKKEGARKQEGTQKLEGIQGQKGMQKEETHPQDGPQQQVIPQQEEIQKQEDTQGGAQNQKEKQGGAQEGAQGGTTK